MKALRLILFVLIASTIVSCADNTVEPELTLSNENLAGDYNLTSFNTNIETSATVSGVTVPVSNTSLVGNTFQVDIIFDTDGTYTAAGEYVIVGTITPVGADAITESEIIVFSDAGSYSVNTLDNTITFMVQGEELLSGTFNVTVFNETTFTISQQAEETLGELTSSININASLERK
tara:strand:+ start:14792 stop:15322 length:531 start_codon:yes stop_codon:yes gene_type:complete